MKKPYVANIESETLNNDNFRKVLFTGSHCQLVVMSLLPGEDIGMEVHPHIDQFIRIEKGTAVAELDGIKYELVDDSVVIIPAGTEHNITNTSETAELKLYTLYSPPEHPDGVIFKTKKEAEEAEAPHH